MSKATKQFLWTVGTVVTALILFHLSDVDVVTDTANRKLKAWLNS